MSRRGGCARWVQLLEEGGSGMRCICSRSTRPHEHKKDLNVPNTDSRQQDTPEENAHPRLADTKAHRRLQLQFI